MSVRDLAPFDSICALRAPGSSASSTLTARPTAEHPMRRVTTRSRECSPRLPPPPSPPPPCHLGIIARTVAPCRTSRIDVINRYRRIPRSALARPSRPSTARNPVRRQRVGSWNCKINRMNYRRSFQPFSTPRFSLSLFLA